jgi:uncharacterized protein YpbB
LVEVVANGEEINKNRIWNSEITQYKLSKIALVKQELQQAPTLLDDPSDNDDTFLNSTKKRPANTKEKKTTQEKTLSLLEQGFDAQQIAKERQLSIQTIHGHFAYLIRARQIELSDVMNPKRILELEQLFDGYEGTSLSPLKEKLGSKVTWDELKLYQAYSQV